MAGSLVGILLVRSLVLPLALILTVLVAVVLVRCKQVLGGLPASKITSANHFWKLAKYDTFDNNGTNSDGSESLVWGVVRLQDYACLLHIMQFLFDDVLVLAPVNTIAEVEDTVMDLSSICFERTEECAHKLDHVLGRRIQLVQNTI
ncbi:hypothetical protein Q9L58_010466 [Maublancomyces gigas]|uniref:Uncharacterized protein n=1 Tax=Discina gigas TaxID=1032678 RepID=A0ABR3G4H4_9PEZI